MSEHGHAKPPLRPRERAQSHEHHRKASDAAPVIMAFQRRPAIRRQAPLAPRESNEHIVLADCRTPARALFSQMAYFNGSIDSSPEDVALVRTNKNELANWFGQTTSALFTATGTTFTARLNQLGDEGDWIGEGENDYGSFHCYQRFYQDRYKYNDALCNMVIDCSHVQPTATPTPSSNTASSPGLSTSAIIGISVGAGGACLLLALMSGYFLWRHYTKKERPPIEEEAGNDTGSGAPPVVQIREPSIKEEPAEIYELHGSYLGNEMTNDNTRAEIDGISRVEMEEQHERFSFAEGEGNEYATEIPPVTVQHVKVPRQ
ncbi:hypothetical protein Micbo1qcDRAFT_49700 [Microdochium bolleyi]|uniref:Uncharacterized protein n=1 Tax=Microdochium bolleyi TaxID=196109 RepID=A0A136J611_9PEZI|nr:hypothetical protein Micbo1qcDRAFT_49700 [Microdochium bolleyi]